MERHQFFFTFSLTIAVFVMGCGRFPMPKSDSLSDPDSFSQVKSSDRKQSLNFKRSGIESARKMAVGLLQNAQNKANNRQESKVFHGVQQSLEGANLALPKPGYDHKACQEDPLVLAFVNLLSPKTIYVCQRAASASPNRLSQILIHEAAHVAGIHDECDATRTEVEVVRRSKPRLAFKNGYMESCGIH